MRRDQYLGDKYFPIHSFIPFDSVMIDIQSLFSEVGSFFFFFLFLNTGKNSTNWPWLFVGCASNTINGHSVVKRAVKFHIQ